MAELLDRARALLAAGPYDARPAEIADVHDALWPDKAPVCPTLTCRRALGVAYYAIQRWASQQDSSTISPATNVKHTSKARFKSDATIYTPHGLGVAYSNDNLTDKAARDILKNDPDAAGLFKELPGEADEEQPDLTPAQASAEQAADKAQASTSAVPTDFDYSKLASALADEFERRAKATTTQPAAPAAPEQPSLTASTGGAAEGEPAEKKEVLPNGVEMTTGHTDGAADGGTDEDPDDEKPVRLSRMNKDQLVHTYRSELGLEPLPESTNDQLRDAIAEHRAAQG